jgi:hypothetical protein
MNISSISNGTGPKPVIPAHPVLRNEAAKAAFGAGVRDTDTTTPGQPSDPSHARLEAFTQRVEARFKAVLESSDLSPRQREALEAQYGKFQSMVSRFEDAYMDGRTPGEGAQQGMQRLLDRFSNSVNHILAGGDAPRDTPSTTSLGSVAKTAELRGKNGRLDTLG